MTSLRELLNRVLRPAALPQTTVPQAPARRPAPGRTSAVKPVTITYSPDPDGDPDPGEIVWTWVPYEDDPRQGKDRPVLIVARQGGSLLSLMLSSKDHDIERDEWMALGSGDWDGQHRPSWVRLDRVIPVQPAGMRREGATLDRQRFDAVAARLRDLHGWA